MSQLEGDWTGRLREAGYKLTAPRLAVLQVLEAAGAHLRVEEVLERARALYPGLGRATVYRTLALLTELGLLRPLYLGERRARLARVAEGHHHLVCLGCGRSFSFPECPVAEVERLVAERFNFEIKGHLLEFYGLCHDCRREAAE